MGFQCNTCGCDNNEIDTQQQVETGKDYSNNSQTDQGNRNLSQMEKQGMSSVNNRKSRMKDVSTW